MSLSTLKMKRTSLPMDRISDLPDQLLTHILSLLPTEEVVRTCVLSKRWKRVWASVPVLVFDDHKGISLNLTGEEFLKREAKFLAFVIGVLRHREALPLDTFELNWYGKFDVSHPFVSRILSSFIAFMPRVLSIHTFTVDFFDLPDSIFTCASVEEMSLEVQTDNGHDYFIETESINLPRLKKLTLGNVSINNDFIGMLLSGCPVLEELVFSWCLFDIDEILSPILKKLTTKYCSQDRKMEISCPGVVSLSIGSFSSSAAITLKNMPSLVAANFFFDDLYYSDDHDLKLLGGLSNVVNLTICTISPNVMESLAADIRNCPALINLKSLEFGEMNIDLDWNSVVRLLQQSPNLTTLTLVFCQPSEEVGQGTLGNVSFQREYLETVKIRCEDKSAEFVEEVIRTLGVVIKSIGEVIIL